MMDLSFSNIRSKIAKASRAAAASASDAPGAESGARETFVPPEVLIESPPVGAVASVFGVATPYSPVKSGADALVIAPGNPATGRIASPGAGGEIPKGEQPADAVRTPFPAPSFPPETPLLPVARIDEPRPGMSGVQDGTPNVSSCVVIFSGGETPPREELDSSGEGGDGMHVAEVPLVDLEGPDDVTAEGLIPHEDAAVDGRCVVPGGDVTLLTERGEVGVVTSTELTPPYQPSLLPSRISKL